MTNCAEKTINETCKCSAIINVFLSASNQAVSLSEYDDLAEIIKSKRQIPVFGEV